MEKLKSFVSKKFVFGFVLIFWVPHTVIEMHKAQLPNDTIMAVIVGLFSIGGVYNFVQGLLDKGSKG